MLSPLTHSWLVEVRRGFPVGTRADRKTSREAGQQAGEMAEWLKALVC
jgi:hypothetical protein